MYSISRAMLILMGFACAAVSMADGAQNSREESAIMRDGKTTRTKARNTVTTAALAAGEITGVEFRGDVEYLEPDRAERLDVYLPADRDEAVRSPAIVMIHGGGWVAGNKAARREISAGMAFARAGYVAISVEYYKSRERGEMWPKNLFDCKNAVRWLRKNADELQVDPERIGVIGGSAGGHLALMVAYTDGVPSLEPKSPYPGISNQVDACVDLYGISNLMTRQSTDKTGKPNGRLREAAIMSKSRQEAPEEWKLASPVEHVTSATPPTLIIHGSADTTVDREQSEELAAKLEAAGVKHKLLIIPGAPHSFILDDSRLPMDLRPVVIKFFAEHLKSDDDDAPEVK